MAKIEAFAAAPQNFAKAKRLAGRDELRLRVGDWRILFTIEGRTITVSAVGHRRDIYD